MKRYPEGHRLSGPITDPDTETAYASFPVIEGACCAGFRLGLITESYGTSASWGDAFVVAPDGSRAGLVWEVAEVPYFTRVSPATDNRWGVFGVGVPVGPTSTETARRSLESLVASLQAAWLASLPPNPRRLGLMGAAPPILAAAG
jgi:hypothetical protein